MVTEADMTGAIWRHCDAMDWRMVVGRLARMSVDTCDLDLATLPEDFGQYGTLSADSTLGRPVPDGQDSEVTTVLGHSDGIYDCGFSPDGRPLVSGLGMGRRKLKVQGAWLGMAR